MQAVEGQDGFRIIILTMLTPLAEEEVEVLEALEDMAEVLMAWLVEN